MKKIKISYPGLFMTICMSVLSISCIQKGITIPTTPDDLTRQMINNPDFLKKSNGENFCWHARVGLDQFVENYELTKDTKWLEAGIKYYDFLLGKKATDPDGYKGWIGVYGYDDNYWQDALVGDAILFDGILNFSVLVSEDKKLKKKYGDKAMLYVDAAKKDLIEKWDNRGCWIDDGPYGTYIEFNKYLKSDNLTRWITAPEAARSGISHPFNKQMDVAVVCLRIYRITGEEFYRARAEKIFFTAKSHFQFFDDHYCWNYYEPLYPGDIDLFKKDTRHGVWVHPWRSGYQASEVDKIVEAYHCGVVFDETDIKRIINTNLNVMWNKDKLHPRFISSNGLGADNDTTGIADFQRTWGHSNITKNSGELWTGLLDFDQRIRDLYELRFRDDSTSIEYLRYKNTVLKSPPCFTRKYIKGEVTVPVINFTECKELSLATVLPYRITAGEETIIICKSWITGNLQIDLLSTDDKKLCNLYNGKINEGIFLITWDGSDPAKKRTFGGAYKIRWTIGKGYREFPVKID